MASLSASSQLPDYTLSVSGGYQSAIRVGNISAHKTLLNPLNDKLFLGLGVRISAFQGVDTEYSTADPELRKTEANIDKLLVSESLHWSGSLLFNAEYAILPKLRAGINFDLLGYTFGNQVTGEYSPGATAANQGDKVMAEVKASPKEKNVFLFGNPVTGSLNTQIFARFVPGDMFSIFGGISYNHSQYDTKELLGVDDHSSFRYQAVLPFIGISLNRFERAE